MIFRPFKPEDYEAISESVRMYSGKIDKNFFEIIKNGVNTTIEDNGKVLACGGVVQIKDNVAEAWIKVSKDAVGTGVFRLIRDGFSILIESIKYDGLVIQAMILSNFAKGARLAKALGFYKTVDSVEINGERYDRYVKAI